MTHSKPHGLALIIGMIAALVTMAVHPTSFDAHASNEAVSQAMHTLVAVHVLGLVCVPVLVFGFAGLTRRIGWQRADAQFAFIVYGLAAVALMFAAIADGLLNAALIPQTVASEGAAHVLAVAILRYNFQINQACAQVYAAGSSLSVLFWSAGLAGSGRRRLGVLGALVGIVTLAALLSGHLQMSAHGFGLIVLLQACWVVAVGVWMLRSDPAPRAVHMLGANGHS